MTLWGIDLNTCYAWYLAFVRVLSIVLLAPILGTRSFPWHGRAGLALFIAIALAPLLSPESAPPLGGVLDLALACGREVLIGVAIGLTASLIFTGVQLAGTIVGYQIGYGIVNVLDPQSDTQVSVIGQFEYLLAVIIFLGLNGHHLVIQALADSFRLVPLGSAGSVALLWDVFARRSGEIFVIALKLGAPAIVALLAVSAALGFMARPVPQLNVFGVGFPVQVALGLIVTAVSLPFFSAVFRGEMAQIPGAYHELLRVFATR